MTEAFDFEGYSAFLERQIFTLRDQVKELTVALVTRETEAEELERTTTRLTFLLLGSQGALEEPETALEVDTPLPFEVH